MCESVAGAGSTVVAGDDLRVVSLVIGGGKGSRCWVVILGAVSISE